MGKIGLTIDLAKAACTYIKTGGKVSANSRKASGLQRIFKFADNPAVKDLKTDLEKMPENLRSLAQSCTGVYKIAPEEKVIEALKELKLPDGTLKFSEEALRTEIKKVNKECLLQADDLKNLYSDNKVSSIVKFAERNDVDLSDIAEFSLLPEEAFSFVRYLSPENFKIFKEFMPYTECRSAQIPDILKPSRRIFTFYQLQEISKYMPQEKIETLRKLRDIKSPVSPFGVKEEYVFSGEELMRLVKYIKGSKADKIAEFAKTSGLKGDSILELVQVEDVDLKALSEVINSIRKSKGGDVVFKTEKSLFDPGRFRLSEWSKANDKEVIVKTYDREMNLISTESITPVKGIPDQVRVTGENFEAVLEKHKIQIPDVDGTVVINFDRLISETRKIRDKDGFLLRTEYLTPSEVEGLHNWKAVMPDGTVKPIIDVKKNRKGILTVKKDMEALDGTVTKSKYRKLPDGSWAMRLNISKDGEILSKLHVKHRRLSANESESTVNGQKFKVLYSPDEIKVLNSNGENDFIIDLKSLIDANNTPQDALKLKNMLKELSADELRVMSQTVERLKFTQRNLEAGADNFTKSIVTDDNIFTLRHELGHLDDLFDYNNIHRGIYSSADKFEDIYTKELKLFMENFPQTQRKYVDYFIDNSTLADSEVSREETVAELLASNKCPDISRLLGTRTEYLERYFPRTRSYLINA